MSQGDKFELGVECPIKNWQFEEWDRWLYIRDAVTSGATVWVSDVDGDELDPRIASYVLSPQNTVIIGPNSSGYSETQTVQSIEKHITADEYFITFGNNLLFDYSAQDKMLIRTAPLGWTPSYDSYRTDRVYARKGAMKYGNSKLDYGVGSSAYIERTAAAGTDYRLLQTTDIDTVLAANGVHRMSTWGYAIGDTGNCDIKLDTLKADGSTIASATTTHNYSGISTWAQNTSTFTPGSRTSKANIYMQIDTVPSTTTHFYLDNLTIEHAQGTDDTASGYYTMTQYADQGSINYDKISRQARTVLVNNTMYATDSSNNRIRYWLSCNFTNATQATYDNLIVLEKHCNDGNNIVFRPFINDLPDVLIGKIRITSPSKNLWNYDYRSFSFRFEAV